MVPVAGPTLHLRARDQVWSRLVVHRSGERVAPSGQAADAGGGGVGGEGDVFAQADDGEGDALVGEFALELAELGHDGVIDHLQVYA